VNPDSGQLVYADKPLGMVTFHQLIGFDGPGCPGTILSLEAPFSRNPKKQLGSSQDMRYFAHIEILGAKLGFTKPEFDISVSRMEDIPCLPQ